MSNNNLILTRLGLELPTEYQVPKKILPEAGVDPKLLYGIELEIENLDADEEIRANRKVPGMEYHKDGSLRNYGGEFVTAPMRRNTLAYVLDQFFQKNKLGAENYSERCSVHVHANCGDLTASQLRLLLCLYQILERVLFNFIKDERDSNIFCVPWSESLVGAQILKDEDSILNLAKRIWKKYTALNVLPLFSQGTIEFRHMAGTCNITRILQWCDIIGSLFRFTKRYEYDAVIERLMLLNTSSAYATFMMDIFDPEICNLLSIGDWRSHLEEGVLNMKFMLVKPEPKSKAKFDFIVDNGQVVPANWVDIAQNYVAGGLEVELAIRMARNPEEYEPQQVQEDMLPPVEDFWGLGNQQQLARGIANPFQGLPAPNQRPVANNQAQVNAINPRLAENRAIRINRNPIRR